MRLLPSLLAFGLVPVAVFASAPSKTIGSNPHGVLHGNLHKHTNEHARGTPAKTAPAEIPSPAPELHKRTFDETCGGGSRTTFTCGPSSGNCIYGRNGELGCCEVDTFGYADSSCTLTSACDPRAEFAIRTALSLPLKPSTLYCSDDDLPNCEKWILSGIVTRPDGLRESGSWTRYGCVAATATTSDTATSYGTVGTGLPKASPTPNYDFLSQNIPLTRPQVQMVVDGLSTVVMEMLPLLPDQVPTNFAEPQKAHFDKQFSDFQKKNPFGALTLVANKHIKVTTKMPEPDPGPGASQNMPVDLDADGPTIIYSFAPVPLNDDERELAMLLWTRFWPRFSSSLRPNVRRRQTDGSDPDYLEEELPEDVAMTVVFNFIASNLEYFANVRLVELYTGTRNVTSSLVTVSDYPGVSFTTVVTFSNIPSAAIGPSTTTTSTSISTSTSSTTVPDGGQVTSPAPVSHTCSDGRVLLATQKCGALRAGDPSQLRWALFFSLAVVVMVVVVVPSFSGLLATGQPEPAT